MSYFNRLFQGRINRRTYVVGSILFFIILIGISIIGLFLSFLSKPSIASIVITIFLLVLCSLNFLFYISIVVKRFHDIRDSHWTSEETAYFIEGEKMENIYVQPPKPKIDI